jgi:hypothetical protein
MNATEALSKALNFVGIPQESFYNVSIATLNGYEVTLQGEYASRHVYKLNSVGFNPRIDGNGFIIADPLYHDGMKVRVVLT